MTFDDQTYQQIEAYLRGHLTEGEKMAFEQKLADQPALAEEVSLWQQADQLVMTQGLKQKMDQDFADKRPQQRIRRKNIIRTASIITAIALLTTTGVLWYNGAEKEKNTITDKEQVHPDAAKGSNRLPSNDIIDTSGAAHHADKQENDANQSASSQKSQENRTDQSNEAEEKNVDESTGSISQQQDTTAKKQSDTTTVEDVTKNNISPVKESSKGGKQSTTTQKKEENEPCTGLSAAIETIRSTPSCAHKATGALSLQKNDSIRAFLLKEGNVIDSSSYHFTTLNPGTYYIKLMNQCGDQKITEHVVTSKVCTAEGAKFNPDIKGFSFPMKEGESFSVTVKDRTGKSVYQKRFDYYSGNTWDGTDSNGQPLKEGVYIYYIINAEGQLILKGEVSISRW